MKAPSTRGRPRKTALTTQRGASRPSSNSEERSQGDTSNSPRYQGLESSLASQKSMYEGSRAKNLALISQLYASRDDIKRQVAECKSCLCLVFRV